MAFDFPAAPIEGQFFAPVGGPLYQFKSPAWEIAGVTTVPGEWVINERIVTTSETYSKPANLAYLEVWAQAGGGGGANTATGVAAEATGGTGGGGGGACYALYDAADLPASVAIAIGLGGGVAATGGTTSFGALMSAAGGGGGVAAFGSGTTVAIAVSAAGGIGTGGDLNLKGGQGYPGIRLNGTYIVGGRGGSAPFGSGGAHSNVGSANGVAGTVGDGGSGATRSGAGAALTGGGGGAGYLRLREYFPAWVLNAAYPPGTIRQRLVSTSETYNKPVGLKALNVKLCASGGGGGYSRSSSGAASGGTGGGGGGYAESTLAAADIPASVAITIATGGIGGNGATPVSPTPGGTTSFGSLVVASGGVAGTMQATTVAAWTMRGAGPGSGTAGQILLLGSYAAGAFSILPNGGNAGMGGNGGDSKLGVGGLGGWANVDGGVGYQGGGGGGSFGSSAQTTNGGNGGNGIAILTEYF